MSKIVFCEQDRKTSLLKKRETARFLGTVLEDLGKTYNEISFILCSDEYLLELNKKYLDHDTLTDVITFDYTEEGVLAGDVFISLDRVRENAKIFEVSVLDELMRVIIHGVLHLASFKDKTEEDAHAMRMMENYYLEKYKNVPRGTKKITN